MDAPLKTTTMTDGRKAQKRSRRRRNSDDLPTDVGIPDVIFSLTLAAVIRCQNPSSETLIKKCLKKFAQCIHSESEIFLNPILSLLPVFLRSKCDEIVCYAARITGALALVSIEGNERIVSDSEILRGLVRKIAKPDKKVVKKPVCNAVLDISTTSFGRERLIENSCLHYLMLGFIQLRKSLTSSMSVIIAEREGDNFLGVEHRADELPLLLLDSIVILINSCNTDQLQRNLKILAGALLTHLKEIWSELHEQLLSFRRLSCSERCCYISSLTAYNLAESIFRLSMDTPTLVCPIQSEIIIRRIFGSQQSCFMNFMSDHWESSLFLMREGRSELGMLHDVFGSSANILNDKGRVPKFLCSILRGMVSCPPIASNEINPLSFLSDVRDMLGCSLVYQEDIRVVRTNLQSKFENHYFEETLCSGVETQRYFSADDILKCEAAFGEGYTIALRGMQFRFESIAAICQQFASLFGQPSVGANLYVTPPNSQGLGCHFDDHCVFVCQLFGVKEWSVLLEPVVHFPRLYEHIQILPESMDKSKKILLREGDVLYIPRGFAHQARTVTGPGDRKNDYGSIHLTIAIEVEPPFQWEGFAHVALHQWRHEMESKCVAYSSKTSEAFVVSILHIAIRLLSDSVPMFLKACLVGASSLSPESKDCLDKNQRTIFNHLINKIKESASFERSFKFLQQTLQRNEDPFHWLRWLEHLNQGKLPAQDTWESNSDGICRMLKFIDQRKDAKAAFHDIKSKFCSEVLFDSVKDRFKILHAMYKRARTQYMNGMLSLHC